MDEALNCVCMMVCGLDSFFFGYFASFFLLAFHSFILLV